MAISDQISPNKERGVLLSLWEKFVFDEELNPEDRRFADILSLTGMPSPPDICAYISIDDPEHLWEGERIAADLLVGIKDFPGIGSVFSFPGHHNHLFLHLVFDTQYAHEGRVPAVRALLEGLQSDLQEKGVSLSSGIDELSARTFTAWRMAVRRAIVSQRLKYFKGRGKVFTPMDLRDLPPLTDNRRRYRQELLGAVAGGRIAEMHLALSPLLNNLFRGNLNMLFYIRIALTELIVLMSRAAIDAGAPEREIFKLQADAVHSVNLFYDLDHLAAAICKAAEDISLAAGRHSGYSMNSLAHSILCRIEASDPEEINLARLSRELNISYVYLSRIFKREFGISFARYLNGIRLDRALLLLADKRKGLGEVSVEAGFHSLHHMERVFRDKYGIAPGSYRKSMQDASADAGCRNKGPSH